ncbi:MAG: FAD-dependent oxidoreductase [Thermodesulfobacteriota bacterium]
MNSVVIIGAGISGLTCAHILKESGFSVTVVDKARGVGGRMATRRTESAANPGKEAIFDHGAQFFTVRDPRFTMYVEKWLSQGVVKEWCRGFDPNRSSQDGYPRYVGTNGMTSAPKLLASDQNVVLNSKVLSISTVKEKWSVSSEDGKEFISDIVILTPPLPQSLDIIDSGNFELEQTIRTELELISYDPCIAVLAEIDGPSQIPDPGAVQINGTVVSWICDNSKKGISEDVNTITIHSSGNFARDNWDRNSDDLAKDILNEVSDLIGSQIISTQVHKWKYCIPTNPLNNYFLVGSNVPNLIFCGEAFGGAKVEGAFLSGLKTAEELIAINQK